MKKLFFALVLGGCVVPTDATKHLPGPVCGEWVTSDFHTASNETEPDSGNVIYVSEDGLALIYVAPVAGVWLMATYRPAGQIVTFKTIITPDQEGPVATLHYKYDPKTETLTLTKAGPPQPASDLNGKRNLLLTLKRRRAPVPAFVRKDFEWRRAHGPPYI